MSMTKRYYELVEAAARLRTDELFPPEADGPLHQAVLGWIAEHSFEFGVSLPLAQLLTEDGDPTNLGAEVLRDLANSGFDPENPELSEEEQFERDFAEALEDDFGFRVESATQLAEILDGMDALSVSEDGKLF